jgi:multiple sugar transport system permease protein
MPSGPLAALLARRSVPGKPRRRSTVHKDEPYGWLFVSPWVLGFFLLTAGPMLISLGLSFTQADMLSPATFIGLNNYVTLFSTDEVKSLFWRTLGNTSFYVFLSVPLVIALGFGLAILLNQELVARGLLRTFYYLPTVIPPVAVSLLWLWVFHRDFGLINGALAIVGIKGPAWLLEVQWAKPALVLMSLWGAGADMLIFLAGLQGVPTELYDASKVDGCGALQRFRYVTFPMVTPTLFFVLITGLVSSFQVFVTTYVMTQGGPANATLMYVLYLYRLAFQQFNMGFASALAWVYFAILVSLSLFIFRSSAAWVYYEGELLGGRGQ